MLIFEGPGLHFGGPGLPEASREALGVPIGTRARFFNVFLWILGILGEPSGHMFFCILQLFWHRFGISFASCLHHVGIVLA